MRGSHLDDQRVEELSVARRWSSVCSPSPAIARRRHGRRRTSSVDHVRIDLANGKGEEDVHEMRHDEEKREG